jgi:hypothetical protein
LSWAGPLRSGRLKRIAFSRIGYSLRRDEDFVVFCFVKPETAEGIMSKKVDGVSIRPVPRLDQGPQSRPASRCNGRGARIGVGEPRAARAGNDPPQRRNYPRRSHVFVHSDRGAIARLLPYVVSRPGVEPWTVRLTAECSTAFSRQGIQGENCGLPDPRPLQQFLWGQR